ncbi:MAG: hypothetical protein MK135_15795 [Polyangiaceae bacterium]|nr:hypothetical protein [Polyangiaceae bacterium]
MDLARKLLPWSTLKVVGPDRKTWLNGIVTCDIVGLEQGKAVWGLLLSKTGKIQSEFHALDNGEELLLGIPRTESDAVAETLEKYLIMEDADIEAAEGTWQVLIRTDKGQKSSSPEELRADLLGQVVRAAEGSESSQWGIVSWGRFPVVLSYVEQGEALLSDSSQLIETEEDWRAQRLLLGKPEFGIDFTKRDNPHEAGLDRLTVSWEKGCYLGQEVVCMQDMRGKLKRRLSVVTAPPSVQLVEGEPLPSQEGDLGLPSSVNGSSAFLKLSAPLFEHTEIAAESGDPIAVAPILSAGS